jgi:cellobiose phosphorylase
VKSSNAESVMIAGLFLYASREMAALYYFLGKGGDAARMRAHYDEMLIHS